MQLWNIVVAPCWYTLAIKFRYPTLFYPECCIEHTGPPFLLVALEHAAKFIRKIETCDIQQD